MKRALRLLILMVVAIAVVLVAGNRRSTASAGSGDNAKTAISGASSAHYYISNTGSDSNNGSRARPWASIQHAASIVKPGDTVHVAPGTYYEAIKTYVSGTPHARIRFVSDQKWGALLKSPRTPACWENKGDFVDLEGFDITGCLNHGVLNWASNVRVIGNHIHDLRVPGCNEGHGGGGIDHANYKGYDDDSIANVVHDIGVPGECNTVHGIYHANLGGHVWNNISFHNSAWGIHLWHAADQVTIANNLVFANGAVLPGGLRGGGIIIGAGGDPGGITANNVTVTNNIAYLNPGWGIREYGAVGHNRYLNNLVYKNGKDVELLNGNTAVDTVSRDPEFVDFRPDGRGDYHLKPTSPALGAGTAIGAPQTDYDGNPRRRYDVGPTSGKN